MQFCTHSFWQYNQFESGDIGMCPMTHFMLFKVVCVVKSFGGEDAPLFVMWQHHHVGPETNTKKILIFKENQNDVITTILSSTTNIIERKVY